MKSLSVTVLLVLAALLGAPNAVADPNILDPYCTGGQIAVFGECKPAPGESYTNTAPGANPDVAVGLDPESVPVI